MAVIVFASTLARTRVILSRFGERLLQLRVFGRQHLHHLHRSTIALLSRSESGKIRNPPASTHSTNKIGQPMTYSTLMTPTRIGLLIGPSVSSSNTDSERFRVQWPYHRNNRTTACPECPGYRSDTLPAQTYTRLDDIFSLHVPLDIFILMFRCIKTGDCDWYTLCWYSTRCRVRVPNRLSCKRFCTTAYRAMIGRSANTHKKHSSRRRKRKLFPFGYRKGIDIGMDGTALASSLRSQRHRRSGI